MTADETCPRCGGDPDAVVEICSFARSVPVRRIPVFRCCVPDPSPAELRRRAEDDWLAWQRELAADA